LKRARKRALTAINPAANHAIRAMRFAAHNAGADILVHRFGLSIELFLGILATSSGCSAGQFSGVPFGFSR
jgi:hypothetical protein